MNKRTAIAVLLLSLSTYSSLAGEPTPSRVRILYSIEMGIPQKLYRTYVEIEYGGGKRRYFQSNSRDVQFTLANTNKPFIMSFHDKLFRLSQGGSLVTSIPDCVERNSSSSQTSSFSPWMQLTRTTLR